MTKEQKAIVEKRMENASQYVKYFLIDTMLKRINELENENNLLKMDNDENLHRLELLEEYAKTEMRTNLELEAMIDGRKFVE